MLLMYLTLMLNWPGSPSFAGPDLSNVSDQTDTTMALTQFVTLDRAYIPPLFFTSAGKTEAARASFMQLRKQWDTFRLANMQLFDDPGWGRDLEKIDQHIEAAREIIFNGKELKLAHEELEQVRNILMEARRRNHFEYFVDYLTDFHEPMEHIVLKAKQTSPDEWTEEVTAEIRSSLPAAIEKWQAVQKAAFIPADYKFNDQRRQKMEAFMAAETKALEELQQSLIENAPFHEIRKTALGIKPNFAGLFKLFGNVAQYQSAE